MRIRIPGHRDETTTSWVVRFSNGEATRKRGVKKSCRQGPRWLLGEPLLLNPRPAATIPPSPLAPSSHRYFTATAAGPSSHRYFAGAGTTTGASGTGSTFPFPPPRRYRTFKLYFATASGSLLWRARAALMMSFRMK